MALSNEDVLLICGRYEETRPAYETLASAMHIVLAKVVENRGLRHMVTHRAKSQSSLYRKLWKDRDNYSASDFSESLSPPMKDLAAARVMLYLQDDIDPIVEALTEHFKKAGHSLTSKDLRSEEKYHAYHLQVTCDGDVVPHSGLDSSTVFEVQICTLSAHIWNELEHDIIYKQPSGKPDAAQVELLVALHGSLKLAAHTADRLMRHTGYLISQNTAPIVDADALQFVLRNRSGKAVRGDFKALFDFLSGLLDPLHNASLHECLETGRSEADARRLLGQYDPDGAHADVGCLLLQVLPKFSVHAIERFVSSRDNPPALFNFVRRVATAIHSEGQRS